MNSIPRPLYWFFTPESIKGKKYLKDIDYIAENTDFDFLGIIMQNGVIKENEQQCHNVIAELVEYAHSKNIKIGLTFSGQKGFLNAPFDATVEQAQAEVFTISNIENAQGMVQEYELNLDENGYAFFESHAHGARQKIRPLYNEILKVYAFDKATEGFYKEGSVFDITDKVQVIESHTYRLTAEIDAGKEYAGKTVYAMIVQYYNSNECYGTSAWTELKAKMDIYKDIPLDGICMDEYGYMMLDYGVTNEKPYRLRFYSKPQSDFFKEKYGINLEKLLFDMRYAPENNDSVRIKAINTYFDNLREPIIKIERNVADYAKKLFGEDIYISAHNTFHNNIERDEVWHTACAWWDLPRKYGHTDEHLSFPVRMGILLSCESPLMMHMYYYKDHYREMVEDAPFNIRIFHHALDDFYWGDSFRESELVENIRRIEKQIARLNEFQTEPPKMDLLIIYGNTAQNNWYPNAENRNNWDINGSLDIFGKCDLIWNNGYRAALVPDYTISDGRVKLENGKISFNGYEFTHCLFLYPQYAKKEIFDLINNAYKSGLPISVIGEGNIDFDGDESKLLTPYNKEFSLEILENMNCPKRGIPNGAVYTNGGFCVTHLNGLLKDEKTEFDFFVDGVHYTGTSTGMIAYRKGDMAIATKGSKLFADDEEVELKY